MAKKTSLEADYFLTGENPGGEEDYGKPLAIDRSQLRGWPSKAVELAEAIGIDPARRLIDAYSNRDYCYVPFRMPLDHPIVLAIGDKAANRLIRAFRMEKLFIPKLTAPSGLKQRIIEAEGSTAEIAAQCGVSPRWVREVRREAGLSPTKRKWSPTLTPLEQKRRYLIAAAEGSTRDVAERFGVSVATVLDCRREARGDKAQAKGRSA